MSFSGLREYFIVSYRTKVHPELAELSGIVAELGQVFDAVHLLKEHTRSSVLRVWSLLAHATARIAVAYLKSHASEPAVTLSTECGVLLQIAKDQPSGLIERCVGRMLMWSTCDVCTVVTAVRLIGGLGRPRALLLWCRSCPSTATTRHSRMCSLTDV